MSIHDTGNLRILLLEDSSLDAELTLYELKRAGLVFVSSKVQNADEFKVALAQFKPSLILSDYRLPNFDGMQALIMALANCPEVPFIVVSGAVGEETAIELLKNGATDFVLKDRLADRLVPAVKRALREVRERQARSRAEADLRALNEQLEDRVAERTRELWAKNAVMEEELGMARELQLAFLPQNFPTLPRGVEQAVSAVKFCSIFHPSSSVSGDFFNVVRVSDTAVGVFICDVMGHGVRAALVTAMMRALEEQLVELAGNPGALLTAMNRALYGILRMLETTLFTTACYIIVDISNGKMTFANAGHPSPFLVHTTNREVESITADKTAGPALGLMADNQYVTHELPLTIGDLILAFTDGLFEVENANAEAFGIVRLRKSISKRKAEPLAQLMQDVFTEVKSFAESQVFADDVCFVGVEIVHLEVGDSIACPQKLFG